MRNRGLKVLLILAIVVVVSVLEFIVLRHLQHTGSKPPESHAADNQELLKMFQDDQGDRANVGNIDWAVVAPRDQARAVRAKELYFANATHTGADYYHVAMILQHSDSPDDYLLAHDLCVAAIINGSEDAKWLAAASEDRFLMSINRPQRYGTQYQSKGPNEDFRLYTMQPGITDALRRIMTVPEPRE